MYVVVAGGQLAVGGVQYDNSEVWRQSTNAFEVNGVFPLHVIEEGWVVPAPDKKTLVYIGGKTKGQGPQPHLYRFKCRDYVSHIIVIIGSF